MLVWSLFFSTTANMTWTVCLLGLILSCWNTSLMLWIYCDYKLSFSHSSIMALCMAMQCRSVGQTPWSRLKYFSNYKMDYHEILYRQSCSAKNNPVWIYWSHDISSSAKSFTCPVKYHILAGVAQIWHSWYSGFECKWLWWSSYLSCSVTMKLTLMGLGDSMPQPLLHGFSCN